MEKNKKFEKIIWAVDPFQDEDDILKSAAACLQALSTFSADFEAPWIQPVYLWTQTPLNFTATGEPISSELLEINGKKAIERALGEYAIPGIQPLHILAGPALGNKNKTHELVEYAKDVGADLIVLSSRGRRGISRLLMGSFAESLALCSDVPFMSIHPDWKKTTVFKTILFPTDFSAESKAAFEKILKFAEKRKSKIVLYHSVGLLIYPIFDSTFSTYSYYRKPSEDELAEIQKQADELTRLGELSGVKVEVLIDSSPSGSISNAIIENAKNLDAVIAMASHSDSLSAVWIGSITRLVIRRSQQPVWVIHPQYGDQSGEDTVPTPGNLSIGLGIPRDADHPSYGFFGKLRGEP